MKNGISKTVWLIAALAVLPASAAALEELTAEQLKGREIARELVSRSPDRNSGGAGVLHIRQGDGNRLDVPVKMRVIAGRPYWQTIYEADVRGGISRLTILQFENQPNQYRLTQISQTGEEDVKLTLELEGEQSAIPFASSDFWLIDLGLGFFHWPDQRLVKSEMRKGRPCKVIDSFNPRPSPAGYSKVRSWVDNETGGLILAEGYGPDGKLLKEFSVKSFEKVNGQWQLKEVEIRNRKTGSRTTLEFNFSED